MRYSTKAAKASPVPHGIRIVNPAPPGEQFFGWLRATPKDRWELSARASTYRACMFTLQMEARRQGLATPDLFVTDSEVPPRR